jgi:hypothetical protein
MRWAGACCKGAACFNTKRKKEEEGIGGKGGREGEREGGRG